MFVARDGALLVNEIAPRPHNSGHYTIDACVDVAVRAAGARAGRPAAGRHAQHTPAVMLNLLGDIWFASGGASAARARLARVLAPPAAKLHLYGKGEPRRGRKMGHVTCLGATLDDALATAARSSATLGIPGDAT